MKRILVVNDDGIHGPGLMPLVRALRRLGSVTALVPERERSTASHALTLHKPLRMHEVEEGVFTLSGTPSDCARFGILRLMRENVDLLVSGINRGHNMGEDVLYSGTVGAAYEGSILGIPSLAVSRAWGERDGFEASAVVATGVARRMLDKKLPPGICLNLNVPDLPLTRLKGLKVCSLGKRVYSKHIAMRKDPRGRAYYWMMGRTVKGLAQKGTDITAVERGFASLTPLLVDLTDRKSMGLLGGFGLD